MRESINIVEGAKFWALSDATGKIKTVIISRIDVRTTKIMIFFHKLPFGVPFNRFQREVKDVYSILYTAQNMYLIFASEKLAKKYFIKEWLPNEIELIHKKAQKAQKTYLKLVEKLGQTERILQKEKENL